MIAIESLTVRGGDRDLLGRLTLRINSGEAVRIAGRNGSGKSTLLSVLAGLRRPDEGEVLVDGHAAGRPGARRITGFLQEPHPLYDYLTVAEHLSMAAGLWGRSAADLAARAGRLGVADQADELVRDLSLGQRKKLALVVATAHDPVLVLLDEPFNGLDDQAVGEVRTMIGRWRGQGRAVVLTSHLLDPLADVVDRTVDLDRLPQAVPGD
ncbi:ATP-binding cassette domain-containing protein [Kitasatospora sp. NPDC089913]|uniref:ATP-binding cassette domain-containing protein n=1 Tax=Kitasatospora sp. NPDC089913 TaxID=3364080 RepID=UPI00381832CE